MADQEFSSEANAVLLSDLIESVLRHSTDPKTCADYLTARIRELVGVRVVSLVECEAGRSHQTRLISISPPRQKQLWDQAAVHAFVSRASGMESAVLIDPARDEAGRPLASVGIGPSFVIPLSVGADRIGMIVLLDIMDSLGAQEVLKTLDRLAGVVALIFRNGLLFRSLEQKVEDRTRQLVESGSLNEQIISNAQEGIVVYGRDLHYRVWNPFMERLSGRSAAEVIGRHPLELFPFLEKAGVIDRIEKALQGEFQPEVDFPYDLPAMGKTGWTGDTCAPLRNAEGEVIGVLGIVRDVTEQRLAEEALRESERRFREILERADLIAVQLDVHGTILFANDYLSECTGWDLKEVIGANWISLFIPEDMREKIRAIHAAAVSQREITRQYENEILTRGGERRLISWTNSYIMDKHGCIAGITSLGLDITERRRLEEQLRRIQKLESVGMLAGGIAHDFNNLLQGVFGYLSMARISIADRDRALSMLEQAERALHLSVNLTGQLLTFSKGGAPVKTLIPLQPVIENAIRFALSGSHNAYRLDVEPSLWPVNADGGQISQVIQNIALNADQAMPLAGTIEISARNIAASAGGSPELIERGNYVAIAIRDQGVGIPGEYLARIFDPYFTTKEKGSGLGLATSYAIIRNHGGMIDVQSQVGKGTVFTVYIPAVNDPLPDGVTRQEHHATDRCRVLVMDDEEVVRSVARELISTLGHDVELAEHGDEAIGLYRRAMDSGKPFDVVLLDLTVRGGKGGLETMKELKKIDPAVKAIVSSGYSDGSAMAEYRRLGFVAALMKPYAIEKLQATLNEALRQ